MGKKKTMFMTGGITPVVIIEVDKFNERSVWINKERKVRFSKTLNFFETKAEAKIFAEKEFRSKLTLSQENSRRLIQQIKNLSLV